MWAQGFPVLVLFENVALLFKKKTHNTHTSQASPTSGKLKRMKT